VKRVLEAAQTLCYEPDPLAQTMRSGSSRTVGFVVRDIANPLFAQIAKGAEDVLRATGYMMVLVNSNGDVALEADGIRLLRRRRVDGLIASLVADEDPRTSVALDGFDRPLVLIDREQAARPATSVLCDHFGGMRDAVADLLQRGHTDIAFVTGPATVWPTRERLRGMQQAHKDASVSVKKRLIVLGEFDAEFAARTTRRLMSEKVPPTAVVAGGLQCTIGVVSALAELRIRLGRDVALVSCDPPPLLTLLEPTVGVVARDTSLIGRRAAELFLDGVAARAADEARVPTQYVPGRTPGARKPAREPRPT
jgi:LacI family transcriptional regulator